MHLVLNSIYTIGVLLVVAIALLFVGNQFGLFGYEVKIVQSGSMEPAIQTGAMIVVAPAATYTVGDVITFGDDTATKIPTTHRIIAVETSELGRTLYQTKGDANEEADPIPVRPTDIIGKVWFDMPFVGYVLEFARTPLGYGLLVGIPALIIVLDAFADITWEIHKHRARKRRRRAEAAKIGAQNNTKTPSFTPITARSPHTDDSAGKRSPFDLRAHNLFRS